ncbi:hypothetical protein BESB_020230 [Besnoitia besnoiti]|uniref:Uncharacterized protein n=1 Tax=Besnoitia besnoiti TaxID=94643 RepID=A0A2A9M9N5_BESBE|nr:hypothetical protein BESB_020230 [Besnoitia besnoiti]PFH32082.1 hypothetical protein BESB_020230 [Besnoitia besnoiti]
MTSPPERLESQHAHGRVQLHEDKLSKRNGGYREPRESEQACANVRRPLAIDPRTAEPHVFLNGAHESEMPSSPMVLRSEFVTDTSCGDSLPSAPQSALFVKQSDSMRVDPAPKSLSRQILLCIDAPAASHRLVQDLGLQQQTRFAYRQAEKHNCSHPFMNPFDPGSEPGYSISRSPSEVSANALYGGSSSAISKILEDLRIVDVAQQSADLKLGTPQCWVPDASGQLQTTPYQAADIGKSYQVHKKGAGGAPFCRLPDVTCAAESAAERHSIAVRAKDREELVHKELLPAGTHEGSEGKDPPPKGGLTDESCPVCSVMAAAGDTSPSDCCFCGKTAHPANGLRSGEAHQGREAALSKLSAVTIPGEAASLSAGKAETRVQPSRASRVASLITEALASSVPQRSPTPPEKIDSRVTFQKAWNDLLQLHSALLQYQQCVEEQDMPKSTGNPVTSNTSHAPLAPTPAAPVRQSNEYARPEPNGCALDQESWHLGSHLQASSSRRSPQHGLRPHSSGPELERGCNTSSEQSHPVDVVMADDRMQGSGTSERDREAPAGGAGNCEKRQQVEMLESYQERCCGASLPRTLEGVQHLLDSAQLLSPEKRTAANAACSGRNSFTRSRSSPGRGLCGSRSHSVKRLRRRKKHSCPPWARHLAAVLSQQATTAFFWGKIPGRSKNSTVTDSHASPATNLLPPQLPPNCSVVRRPSTARRPSKEPDNQPKRNNVSGISRDTHSDIIRNAKGNKPEKRLADVLQDLTIRRPTPEAAPPTAGSEFEAVDTRIPDLGGPGSSANVRSGPLSPSGRDRVPGDGTKTKPVGLGSSRQTVSAARQTVRLRVSPPAYQEAQTELGINRRSPQGKGVCRPSLEFSGQSGVLSQLPATNAGPLADSRTNSARRGDAKPAVQKGRRSELRREGIGGSGRDMACAFPNPAAAESREGRNPASPTSLGASSAEDGRGSDTSSEESSSPSSTDTSEDEAFWLYAVRPPPSGRPKRVSVRGGYSPPGHGLSPCRIPLRSPTADECSQKDLRKSCVHREPLTDPRAGVASGLRGSRSSQSAPRPQGSYCLSSCSSLGAREELARAEASACRVPASPQAPASFASAKAQGHMSGDLNDGRPAAEAHSMDAVAAAQAAAMAASMAAAAAARASRTFTQSAADSMRLSGPTSVTPCRQERERTERQGVPEIGGASGSGNEKEYQPFFFLRRKTPLETQLSSEAGPQQTANGGAQEPPRIPQLSIPRQDKTAPTGDRDSNQERHWSADGLPEEAVSCDPQWSDSRTRLEQQLALQAVERNPRESDSGLRAGQHSTGMGRSQATCRWSDRDRQHSQPGGDGPAPPPATEKPNLSRQRSSERVNHRTRDRSGSRASSPSSSGASAAGRRQECIPEIRAKGTRALSSSKLSTSKTSSLCSSADSGRGQPPLVSQRKGDSQEARSSWSRPSSTGLEAECALGGDAQAGEVGNVQDAASLGKERSHLRGGTRDPSPGVARLREQSPNKTGRCSANELEPQGQAAAKERQATDASSSQKRSTSETKRLNQCTRENKRHSSSTSETKGHRERRSTGTARSLSYSAGASVTRKGSLSPRRERPRLGRSSGSHAAKETSANVPAPVRKDQHAVARKERESGRPSHEARRSRAEKQLPDSTEEDPPRVRGWAGDSAAASSEKRRASQQAPRASSLSNERTKCDSSSGKRIAGRPSAARDSDAIGGIQSADERGCGTRDARDESQIRDLQKPEKGRSCSVSMSSSRDSSSSPGGQLSVASIRGKRGSRRRYERSPPKTFSSQDQEGDRSYSFSSHASILRPQLAGATDNRKMRRESEGSECPRAESLERGGSAKQDPPKNNSPQSRELTASPPGTDQPKLRADRERCKNRRGSKEGGGTQQVSGALPGDPCGDAEAVEKPFFPQRQHPPEQAPGRSFSEVTMEPLAPGPGPKCSKRSFCSQTTDDDASAASVGNPAGAGRRSQNFPLESASLPLSLCTSIVASFEALKKSLDTDAKARVPFAPAEESRDSGEGGAAASSETQARVPTVTGNRRAEPEKRMQEDRPDFSALVRDASRALQNAQEILAKSGVTPGSPPLPSSSSAGPPESRTPLSEQQRHFSSARPPEEAPPSGTRHCRAWIPTVPSSSLAVVSKSRSHGDDGGLQSHATAARTSPSRTPSWSTTQNPVHSRHARQSLQPGVDDSLDSVSPCTSQTLVSGTSPNQAVPPTATQHSPPASIAGAARRLVPNGHERASSSASETETSVPEGNYAAVNAPRSLQSWQQTCGGRVGTGPLTLLADTKLVEELVRDGFTMCDTGSASHFLSNCTTCSNFPQCWSLASNRNYVEQVGNPRGRLGLSDAELHASQAASSRAAKELMSPCFPMPKDEGLGSASPGYLACSEQAGSSVGNFVFQSPAERVPVSYRNCSSANCPVFSFSSSCALGSSPFNREAGAAPSTAGKSSRSRTGLEAATASEAEPFGQKAPSVWQRRTTTATQALGESSLSRASKAEETHAPPKEVLAQWASRAVDGYKRGRGGSPLSSSDELVFSGSRGLPVKNGTSYVVASEHPKGERLLQSSGRTRLPTPQHFCSRPPGSHAELHGGGMPGSPDLCERSSRFRQAVGACNVYGTIQAEERAESEYPCGKPVGTCERAKTREQLFLDFHEAQERIRGQEKHLQLLDERIQRQHSAFAALSLARPLSQAGGPAHHTFGR